MFLPEVEENTNNVSLITQWRGYNHNYSIDLGEFYDMENMTVDDFPAMTARDIRPTLLNPVHAFRGILYTDGVLCWLDGNVFHFQTWQLDLTEVLNGTAAQVSWSEQHEEFTDTPDAELIEWSEQKMIRFGVFVLIYPINVWVNIDKRTAGLIDSVFESDIGLTITYSISTQEGGEYQNLIVDDEAPENPSEGDYWLNTTVGSEGLNVYVQSSWQPVPTCYIKISIPGADLTDYFKVGDIVNMNSDAVPDINNGSMVQAVGTDTVSDEDIGFITVIGLMDSATKTETTSSGYKLTIVRKMPQLDYMCADKNRLWGCKYGTDDSGIINEIYASKLGDFKNWYSYQGLSTDSYSATIGIPGRFTGCISYGGYPTFFKENAIIRVSGNYPAEYNVMQMDARGVQEGSDKSLAIVGEALYYKAPGGVMVYDGSLPRMISHEFGRSDAYYYDGVAGVCGSKYYLELTTAQGAHRVFVYDAEYGLWTKENHIGETPNFLLGFSGAADGRLFAFTYDHVYGIGLSDNELYTDKQPSEEYASWFLQSGDIGIDIPEFKYVSKITLRAYIPAQSEIEVSMAYDDRNFEPIGTIRGLAETMTHTLSFAPYRCDHFRFKLSGHGRVRLYSMAISYDMGSDEYEYKN